MKPKHILLISAFSLLTCISWKPLGSNWIIEKRKSFNLLYTINDTEAKDIYVMLVENGVKSTQTFFSTPYKEPFDVYIHPNRHSLDSTWQHDWNAPDYKSECWMVASGIATRFDMISPGAWGKEACEHNFSEKKKTQQLITHELIHVYHGQLNFSPDFSNVEGIEWFVEGLATYASGQCDSIRIANVKMAIAENAVPDSLDEFAEAKLRYGLCGSLVKFMDRKYGRAKLIALLPFNKKSTILSNLKITEAALLAEWKEYVRKL